MKKFIQNKIMINFCLCIFNIIHRRNRLQIVKICSHMSENFKLLVLYILYMFTVKA